MLSRFITKKVAENTTVGECLRSKREELGISLYDLSKKLKIKLEYLENLENNFYDGLPPEVYVKGFIRSYANFAGYNSEKMVDMYRREMTVKNKIEKVPANKLKEKKFSSPNYPIITPKLVTIFFSLLVLTVVGYYLWYQINSFSSKPYLFVSSPTSNISVDDPEITLKGETEKEIVIEINGENVFVDQEGHFEEVIMLQPGRNQIIIEAKNRFNKTKKEEINVNYEKKIGPIPENYINKTDNTSINVENSFEIESPIDSKADAETPNPLSF
jgi:hypothetical protein